MRLVLGPAALDASEHNLLEATNIVLKEEWKRVKRGEHIYRGATLLAGLVVLLALFLLLRTSVISHGNRNLYRVVERADINVDKEGRVVSDQSYDHDVVQFILAHDKKKIYAQCDLSTLDKIDPNASCGLRPLRDYQCFLGREDVLKAPIPFSDLTCTDRDGRKVYLYVTKEE